MIQFRVAQKSELSNLVKSRFEMMRTVNHLSQDYVFEEEVIENTKKAFLEVDQDTVLAVDGDTVVGCATACYHSILPTFTNPTGKRAYILNVYTHQAYRCQGIGTKMIEMLIALCRQNGVYDIGLDASPMGFPVYTKLGFCEQAHFKNLVLNLYKKE